MKTLLLEVTRIYTNSNHNVIDYSNSNHNKLLSLKHFILFASFSQYWLYWNVLLSIPIGNYYFHFGVFISLITSIIILLNSQSINRHFYLYVLCSFYTIFIFGIIAFINGTPRFLDLFLSTTYFVSPFFFVACLKDASQSIIHRLLTVTLLFFALQQILGALGFFKYLTPVIGTQYLFAYDEYDGIFRPNNTLGGATTGCHIALLLTFCYLQLINTLKLRHYLLLFLISFSLSLSFSRAVWIGIILLWVSISLQYIKGRLRQFVIYICILAAFSVFIFATIGTAIVERHFSPVTLRSDESRFFRIAEGINTFANSNKLFAGTGFGSSSLRSFTAVNTQPILPNFFTVVTNENYYLGSPHNTYIVLINELGLLGFVILVFLTLYMLIIPYMKNNRIILITIVYYFCIYMNTEITPFFPKSTFPFALALYLSSTSSISNNGHSAHKELI